MYGGFRLRQWQLRRMGDHSSAAHAAAKAKSRSDAIDRQLDEEAKRYKRECRILMLGSSGSGKSTVLKQLKIAYGGGFSGAELAEYRLVVYRNVLDSAQAVVNYMRKIGIECSSYDNRILAENIINYRFKPAITPELSPEIANAIHQVWNDPIIPKIMDEHTDNFHMDNAGYFLGEVLRIGMPGYLPNETDILRSRATNHDVPKGVTEAHIAMGMLSVHIFDIDNQRSARKKWIHNFEGVTSIIFCTALSDYDQVTLEVNSLNRLSESLVLFESIINSRWFLRTSIILLLNKMDIFKRKLPKVPLARYFPEYIGGNDINKAAKYILWCFMQANRARLSVYPHLTQAVTDTITYRLVFAAVKETILQNALQNAIKDVKAL